MTWPFSEGKGLRYPFVVAPGERFRPGVTRLSGFSQWFPICAAGRSIWRAALQRLLEETQQPRTPILIWTIGSVKRIGDPIVPETGKLDLVGDKLGLAQAGLKRQRLGVGVHDFVGGPVDDQKLRLVPVDSGVACR